MLFGRGGVLVRQGWGAGGLLGGGGWGVRAHLRLCSGFHVNANACWWFSWNNKLPATFMIYILITLLYNYACSVAASCFTPTPPDSDRWDGLLHTRLTRVIVFFLSRFSSFDCCVLGIEKWWLVKFRWYSIFSPTMTHADNIFTSRD